MKKLAIVVVLGLVVGGGWVFLHPDKAQKLENQAETAASQAADNPQQAAKDLMTDADKAAIKADLEIRYARVKLLKEWIAACSTHTQPVTMKDSYDAFSYDKGDDYKSQEAEQEKRISDLQARLNGAYGR
jgi:hypothetical protein